MAEVRIILSDTPDGKVAWRTEVVDLPEPGRDSSAATTAALLLEILEQEREDQAALYYLALRQGRATGRAFEELQPAPDTPLS